MNENISVSRVVKGPINIFDKVYDNIILVAAPFEKQDVVNEPSILMTKLASAIDDLIIDDLESNPDFIFCSAFEVKDVPDYESILSYLKYDQTEDTLLFVRAFGIIGEDIKDPEFVEHLSYALKFTDGRVLFFPKTTRKVDEYSKN